MSAFVVSPETMDRAVAALVGNVKWGRKRFEMFGGITTDNENAASTIGGKLFSMNLDAVSQRYPKDSIETLPGPVDKTGVLAYRHVPRHSTLIQQFKSLQCLRYQCAEGSVVESSLFVELCRAISTIAEEIVSDLPEYAAATWDY